MYPVLVSNESQDLYVLLAVPIVKVYVYTIHNSDVLVTRTMSFTMVVKSLTNWVKYSGADRQVQLVYVDMWER